MSEVESDQVNHTEAEHGRVRSAASSVFGTGSSMMLPAVIAIFAVTSAIYFNALFNGFVYDDIPQVLENRWITDVKYIPDMFSGSVHSFQQDTGLNYYRPIMHVLYLLTNYLFGLAPWGFHLVNILFHAGVSILVYLICLRLVEQPSTASPSPPAFFRPESRIGFLSTPFVAALLFATHPIHTEAVTWVAGIPDLSFSFFCLLSFVLYIGLNGRLEMPYMLSLVSFAVALFCKETAVTFPIVLVAYDYAFNREKERPTFRWSRYLPYLAVIGLYLIIRTLALGGFAPARPGAASPVGIINVFLLFMIDLEKLLLPVHLNFIHTLQPLQSLLDPESILSLGVFAAFVLAAIVSSKKQRMIFFGLVLIVVPLLPVFYIPGRGVGAFAERYLYFPSLGFTIILAQLFEEIRIRRRRAIFALLGVLFVVCLYSAGTVMRNAIWKNDITLFRDVVSKSPSSPHPHFYLGMSYLKAGDYDNAIVQLQTALSLGYRTGDVAVYHALGVAFFNKGMMDKAVGYFTTAERIDPSFAETHFYLGMAYGNMRLLEIAVEQFQLYLRLRPENAVAHFDLGLVYADAGRAEKALEQFEDAVRLSPDNPLYRNRLDEAYRQRNHDR